MISTSAVWLSRGKWSFSNSGAVFDQHKSRAAKEYLLHFLHPQSKCNVAKPPRASAWRNGINIAIQQIQNSRDGYDRFTLLKLLIRTFPFDNFVQQQYEGKNPLTCH